MTPNQDDGGNPRVAATIPSNQKTALEYIAHERSTPGNRVYIASIVSDAVLEYLINHWDELPGEARDLLDADLEANAGGDVDVDELAQKHDIGGEGE